MTSSRPRSAISLVGARDAEVGACEVRPDLGQELLLPSRSGKVCVPCHWFRHHAGAQCMPLLTCQWHQGWADNMASQSGWERWQQEVEVTSGEWLQGQATPLLKRRQRLSRDEAVQLWRQRRADGWSPCSPQWQSPQPPRMVLRR